MRSLLELQTHSEQTHWNNQSRWIPWRKLIMLTHWTLWKPLCHKIEYYTEDVISQTCNWLWALMTYMIWVLQYMETWINLETLDDKRSFLPQFNFSFIIVFVEHLLYNNGPIDTMCGISIWVNLLGRCHIFVSFLLKTSSIWYRFAIHSQNCLLYSHKMRLELLSLWAGNQMAEQKHM